jgi:hypothetical protein
MMIRVIRQGEASISPSFSRELKLIDTSLFVAWDALAERYLIVSHGPSSVFRDSFVLEDVVCDDFQRFLPLDNRSLIRLKIAKMNMNGVDSYFIDKARKAKEKRLKAFMLYLEMKKEFYKKFYKLWKTKTFDLGGK